MCQVLTKRTKTDNEKKRLLELNFKWSLIEEVCYVKINKCESWSWGVLLAAEREATK